MRHCLLALCLLLAPCATAQMVEEALSANPGPLDFIRGEGYEQWIFQSLAGDALVGISPTGRLVPRLAHSWSTAPDGTLHFRLRGDARFADGQPVSAEDVVWTFQELQRNPSASPTKRAVLQGAGVGLQGGQPWIRSPKPPGRLLLELARLPIARAGQPQVGSGPFAFSTEPGAWVFRRREHFLAPQVEGIRFRLLPDAGAVTTALRKGWLSLGAPVPGRPQEPPPTHRLLRQAMHAQFVVWSRSGDGPLRLLETWRRDAFPPGLLGANARPSRGLWPETLGFPVQGIPPRVPLPEVPRVLHLAFTAGEPLLEKLLLALRERARRDGYDLRLAPQEQGLLVARLTQGDFDMAGSMVVFEPHPWAVLEFMEPGGPMNFTGWSHPALATLVPRLRHPDDPAWRDLQNLWAQHLGALPLLDFQSVLWVDRHLEVTPSPLGLYLSTPGAAGWRWH